MGGVISLSATYFTLQADIEEAKKLPKMPISEKEFELKDALIRQTILNNGQQLETQQAQRLQEMEIKVEELVTVKDEMLEIKSLLQKLVNTKEL